MSSLKKQNHREARLVRKYRRGRIAHAVISVLTLLTLVLAIAVVALYTIFAGPSRAISDRVISSVTETSALKFLPYLFLPAEEVDAALERTSFVALDAVTNTSLYTFGASDEEAAESAGEFSVSGESGMAVAEQDEETDSSDSAAVDEEKDDPFGVGPGIEIVRITGPTYKGWMAIIDDPSRVSVGISSEYTSSETPGLSIAGFCEKYDAILAVNGGAFNDPNGSGNGGTPLGLVYSNGVLYHGATKGHVSNGGTCVGFDYNDRLIVGRFTTSEAMQVGYRDAVAFGPALIVNGEPSSDPGSNASLNPRTAIGQRADGAVLLLVVDGRQLDSLGASFGDLVEIFMEYGAINACNLDGGSSTVMYVNGQQLNDGVAVTGSRAIPTAIIVQ